MHERLQALTSLLATDDGQNLLAGYKRAANILKSEEKKSDLSAVADVREDRLEDAAEKELFVALTSAQSEATLAIAGEDFTGAMRELARIRLPLDRFFETVTVNAADPDLRENRLALLIRFRNAVRQIADFEALEG